MKIGDKSDDVSNIFDLVMLFLFFLLFFYAKQVDRQDEKEM